MPDSQRPINDVHAVRCRDDGPGHSSDKRHSRHNTLATGSRPGGPLPRKQLLQSHRRTGGITLPVHGGKCHGQRMRRRPVGPCEKGQYPNHAHSPPAVVSAQQRQVISRQLRHLTVYRMVTALPLRIVGQDSAEIAINLRRDSGIPLPLLDVTAPYETPRRSRAEHHHVIQPCTGGVHLIEIRIAHHLDRAEILIGKGVRHHIRTGAIGKDERISPVAVFGALRLVGPLQLLPVRQNAVIRPAVLRRTPQVELQPGLRPDSYGFQPVESPVLHDEPVVPDFEIPYHTEIMENFDGIDMDAAGRVAGQGFYYLMGDIARLHSAILSYARDFMIDRGFTYVIPPYMIRSNVVTGVMSFEEMDSMMYKIEGEDLYLIGTSEHSMIGKFIDNILEEDKLPYTYTSYSPCFRKEKGAHGIEERGVYRIHQFEKQEMIVVCKPEDSKMWFEKLWNNTVDLFRSLDIPVRTLECCSGDLADLKSKSIDVEAWSPRQKKYFEVGSCSNLTDAQARRLNIRINGENGKYFAHTLNNTVVAPPRMLIAFLENNLNDDGSVNIPKALQPYMGGKEKITK